MARHVWSVLCSKTLIDKNSNNTSLIEIVEAVSVDAEPIHIESKDDVPRVQASYDFVTLWTRDDPDVPETGVVTRLIVKMPNGWKLSVGEQVFDLENSTRMRVNRVLSTIPIQGPGVHELVIQRQKTLKSGKKRWYSEASIPLEVSFEPLSDSD